MTNAATKSKTATQPSVGDTGRFAETPLPKLLVDLYRSRFSGALEIERGNTNKRVVFQRGAPMASESNLASETLGVQLMNQGTITQEDHGRVTAYMNAKKCKEGVALLALDLLKPKALFLALKEQVRRRIVEAFAWSDGRYSLCAYDDLEPIVASMRSDPLSLIREGLVNHWTPDRLLVDLTACVDQFPVRIPDFEEAQRRLADDAELALVFDRIDGSVSFGTAIGSGFNSLKVLASVWILVTGKLVRFEQVAVVDGESETGGTKFERVEIEVVAKGATPNVVPSAPKSATQTDAMTTSKTSERANAMREEVLALADGLRARSLYDLIGVPRNASHADVRKAYFNAAKRFHPDALARLGLADIKEQAAAVFGRIAEANDVLRDPAKRAAYDARGSDDETDIDTAALGQAETFYRKGEILIRMGDFRGALEYLRSAVELWPDECVYQSALGWALYKQPEANREQSLVHLEKAVSLDDTDAVAVFRLGMVLRSVGNEQRGAECLARAKMLDPKAH